MGLTEKLYLTDSYLREFTADVVTVDAGRVFLSRTAFYPGGGGQPPDRGLLAVENGPTLSVVGVGKTESGDVYHEVQGGLLNVGERVKGIIDWGLRYAHMRHHTALHIVSGVAFKLFGAKISGSQIYADRARIDLDIKGFDKSKLKVLEDESNRIVAERRGVSVRFIQRDEALANPSLYRLGDDAHIPAGETLRIIEIDGFDAQLDGGTHVANTAEVGKIVFAKYENKGVGNKRIEIVLERRS
ncbi:MAG TPA: alanyl-tRNA editing protein [bacterium]|nr:alanyl-tRNA editing protein [bacterium]